MTPSATQSEKQAMTQANNNQNLAAGNESTVSNNNSQLNGAVQDTGYYQNEVKSGTQAVQQGADASARNLKQSMEAAGVQGNSGVSAGNNVALQAQQQGQESQVKTNAYADTEKQQQSANAQDLQAANTESQTGLGYANINNSDAMTRAKQGWANTADLANSVSNAAATFFN